MRKRSPKSSRNLLISSSVRQDLPDPPVPVMPSTGAGDPVSLDLEALVFCQRHHSRAP